MNKDKSKTGQTVTKHRQRQERNKIQEDKIHSNTKTRQNKAHNNNNNSKKNNKRSKQSTVKVPTIY